MYGPTLLLQHWAWSRLPVGRPIANEAPGWGNPDPDRCPAFAKKWHGVHHYEARTHGSTIGIRPVRSELQSLGAERVDWTPYQLLYAEGRLPITCLQQQDMWYYRGPLVHFWIVEHHYPDRVLRQFGHDPFIPADPSLLGSTIRDLHK